MIEHSVLAFHAGTPHSYWRKLLSSFFDIADDHSTDSGLQ